ncbi:SDR family oxidoreductase [Parasphingorhabdus cellanae]|uniref:SDR family oxidoreductase n=1 Tax=Parasphingorhabdus cellanae TaxID=2806553 RepID=A0ABX7SZ44_9SPHN|nr:SDR family oxidoreductase [Parasphingorhabdus cellanae]QTD54546.1 SDR family oxidoreductase [Parasphingorhabdus cellanae]
MKLNLENKTVLVTAGSKGIGLATALGFHACGAKVAICGRSQDNLDAAAAQMPGCLALVGDVSQSDDIDRVVQGAGDKFGGIDILVNNAGGPPPGLFEELADEDWDKAVQLTLMSVIRTTRLVLPHMRAQKWGRIVNISSSGVKQPVPGLTLSNSIRMAVLGWAKTLANQVAGDNILVNTVCPGFTNTDRITQIFEKQSQASGKSIEEIAAGMAAQIPMQRIGQPEEIANLAVFLGSEAASYITGTAIQVDGGSVQGF